jgi:hypothetical protein
MPSRTLKALTRASLPMFALLGSTACVGGRPIVVATASACSSLLPVEWMNGVPSSDVPNGGQTVGDWVAFGDAQTAQLDKANERYSAGVGIIQRCEKRDAEAVKRARPKFLGIF